MFFFDMGIVGEDPTMLGISYRMVECVLNEKNNKMDDKSFFYTRDYGRGFHNTKNIL